MPTISYYFSVAFTGNYRRLQSVVIQVNVFCSNILCGVLLYSHYFLQADILVGDAYSAVRDPDNPACRILFL